MSEVADGPEISVSGARRCRTEGSIRLHEKHGFAILGTFPDLGFKFDRWVGIVHMQRAL